MYQIKFTMILCNVLLYFLISNRCVLVKSQTTCSLKYECANSTIEEAIDDVECSGYRSCTGSNITANSEIQCSGAYSCYKSGHLEPGGAIYCRGDGACLEANILYNGVVSGSVACVSPNSCVDTFVNSSISNVLVMTCPADNSCSQSDIVTSSLYGYGGYSLNNATIQSTNDFNDLDVYLGGYFAGYGATVVCQDGDTCEINCYGNACYNLSFICQSGASCSVVCDNNASIACPNGYQENTFVELDQVYEFELLYNALQISKDNDDICNSNSESDSSIGTISSNNLCDDSFECNAAANFDANSSICCRGRESCASNADIITSRDLINCNGYRSCYLSVDALIQAGETQKYDTQHNASIYCDSDEVCRYSTIVTSGIVHCDYYGCFNTQIHNATYLYCMGDSSCRQSNIFNVSNIYVLGYNYAMWTTNIYSSFIDAMNVYLLSGDAGRGLDIYCNETTSCYVECGVNGACDPTLLLNVHCLGTCVIYCDTLIGIECPTVVEIGNYSNVTYTTQKRRESAPVPAPTILPTTVPTAIPNTNFPESTIATTTTTTSTTFMTTATTATTVDTIGVTVANETDMQNTDPTTTEQRITTTGSVT